LELVAAYRFAISIQFSHNCVTPGIKRFLIVRFDAERMRRMDEFTGHSASCVVARHCFVSCMQRPPRQTTKRSNSMSAAARRRFRSGRLVWSSSSPPDNHIVDMMHTGNDAKSFSVQLHLCPCRRCAIARNHGIRMHIRIAVYLQNARCPTKTGYNRYERRGGL